MEAQSRTVEEKIAEIARAAHGVVTRQELFDAGISRMEIRRRLQKGLLIRQYPGVYRVGHAAPSIEASFVAAVKACGEGAFLRGRAGGCLLGLVKRPPPRPEVWAPTERRIEGIEVRRARRSRKVIVVKGIPVTYVPET